MVITLPQLQLKFPSIQFPSFFVARRNARLITDSAEAPYVVTGTQTMQGTGGGTAVVATASAGSTNLVAPQPTLAAPAYVAASPQTVGMAATYSVGPQPAYALASPDAAAAAGSLPPGRWVLIQGPAGPAARATGQPRTPGDAEDLEAKFRQLLEREQHLQDRIEELQRYILQHDLQGSAVPACPRRRCLSPIAARNRRPAGDRSSSNRCIASRCRAGRCEPLRDAVAQGGINGPRGYCDSAFFGLARRIVASITWTTSSSPLTAFRTSILSPALARWRSLTSTLT